MGQFPFHRFVYSQLFGTCELVKADLSGKYVIVTGSNVGLGKETARLLAGMKPERLIIACRDTSKGQTALQDIKNTTGISQIEVWQLDLADFASVKAFADKALKQLPRLDIVVQNAGVSVSEDQKTKDGWERTLQVNCIATTLLALLLLPLLRKTVKEHKVEPRMVLVGSEVHYWSTSFPKTSSTPIKSLNEISNWNGMERYQVSKLLDVLVSRELGNHLAQSKHPEDKSIKVNCPSPGLCHSELGRDSGIALTILKFFLARTTEYGARNFVWAALGPQKESDQGGYITNCGFEEPSDFVVSDQGTVAQRNIWNELNGIYAKVAPEALKVF